MKKLMIAACAIALAGVVQAATATWGSGAIRTAEDADGGWSSTAVNAAGALVTMNIYFIDSETYDDLAEATQQEIYDAYSRLNPNLTGQNKNATTGALIGAITINESAETALEAIEYAVAIATYTDETYGDMFIATRAKTTYNAGTKRGSATGIIATVGNWQGPGDVPEPTSGLLMLLGMAGLALRRKHA